MPESDAWWHAYQRFCEVWRVIRLNVIFHEGLATHFHHYEVAIAVLITLANSASLFHLAQASGEISAVVIQILVVVSTLVIALKPIMKLNEGVTLHKQLVKQYRILDHRAETIYHDICHLGSYTSEHEKQIAILMGQLAMVREAEPETRPMFTNWEKRIEQSYNESLEQLTDEFLQRASHE
jgi:hypothetical protein